MKAIIPLIIISCIISSCGPNAEELAATQRQHDDSVATVAANAAKQKTEEKFKLENNIAQLKNALENAKAELVVANNELNHAQEFHFLRTDAERTEQVRVQALKVQRLTDYISDLEQKLSTSQSNMAMYQ